VIREVEEPMPGKTAVWQRVLQGLPGAAVVVSGDGVVTWANPAAAKFIAQFCPSALGAAPLAGRSLRTLLPEALAETVFDLIGGAPMGEAALPESERFRVALAPVGGVEQMIEVTLWPVRQADAGIDWVLQLQDSFSCPVRTMGDDTGAALAACALASSRNRAADEAEILRIATENSDVVPWYRLPEQGFGWINATFATMLGYPPGYHIDLSVLGPLIHPDDRPQASAQFWAVHHGQRDTYCHDFRIRRADGSWAWVTSRGRRVDRSAQGLPPMVCGSLTDISARKADEARLAEALAEAEAARHAAQTTAETLTTALICGETIVWSICSPLGESWMPAHCYAQLGYTPETFTPDDAGWRSIFHPDDLAEAVARMEDLVFDRSKVFESEHRLRHGDGSYHWYRTVARKIDRSDRGLPFVVNGALNCIDHIKENERRLAEAAEAAQQERARLDTLADNAPGALFEYRRDNDGRIDFPYFSAKLPGMLGVSHEAVEADGTAVFRNVPAAVSAILFADIEQSRRTGTKFEARFPVNLPDQGTRWLSVSSLPFEQPDGATVWCGTVFDVTEEVEAETQAAVAADALRNAHDRMMTLAENVPGALFEWQRRPDGRSHFAFFSSSLPEILGLAAEELESDGAAVYQRLVAEDRLSLRDAVEHSEKTLSRLETRFRIQHPTRGQRVISFSASPFRRGVQDVVWYGYVLDITEVVEADQLAIRGAAELRKTHERMMTMAENAPGAIFEWRFSPQSGFRFEFFSAALPEMVGVSRATLEADGLAVKTHIHPEDDDATHAAIVRSMETMTRFEVMHRINHPQRGLRWLLVSASPFPAEGGGIVWYGNTVDVTEREEAKARQSRVAAEAARAHERLASIASIAPVGLYEFHAKPDGSGSFPYTSPFFEDLLGVGYGVFARATSAEDMFVNVAPEDRPAFLTGRDNNLELWNQRFRVRHPTRGELWLANSATPKPQPDGSVVWTGALHDVTQDVQREAELRHAHRFAEEMRAENERQALHDGLTGLPNRRSYDLLLANRISGAGSGGPKDCVLIRVDLDHFKYVNDTLGHEAGDLVLQRVAEVLRDCLRAGDFAARIGGDEFSILLAPGARREDAAEIVERIQARVAEPMLYEGRQCRFGASFGMAETSDLAAMGVEIQAFADAALYRAKSAGRNRMSIFTPELHQNILLDRRLAVEIQEGLERGEFVPFFQAQVGAQTGLLTGVETLLRWRHPSRGLLVPAQFMHVAEQLRIVPEIDRVMMEKSHLALEIWRAQGLTVPKISFNVSAGRMHDPDVVRAARFMADGATKVTFELLESILVEEESEAFRFHLDAIREAGIDIEIDDFGSGHASIIGLMQIAPSALKIDRRIIAPVSADQRSRNLVRAIIEIAETLGIGTVAEGVETEAQAHILRDLGCDVLQGYLFSLPLSAEDFLASKVSTRLRA